MRLANATVIAWEDATECTLTHVDNTGLSLNLALAVGGALTVTGNILPGSAGGSDLGTTAAEWRNLYLTDGGILYLGADQDVTLTHVADTGVRLNAAMQLQFRDTAIHIASLDDGHLDLTADTSIDLNGAVVATGTVGVATSLNPDASDGATLGTTALEWSDLYLADGGVIYFQNDQSVYLTPSAGTLTLTGAFVADSISTTRTTDPQYMRLYEGNGEAGDNYFQITATAMAANVALTAPSALPGGETTF